MLSVIVLLTACSRQQTEDFCNNHYLFHASHIDDTGNLEITHSSDGFLRGELSLPQSLFNMNAASVETLRDKLKEVDNVFSFQTEAPCEIGQTVVNADISNIVAIYEMECGAEVAIKQIDVLLFNHLAELEEIVVGVTTPATQKQFAISRQCDSAIFRLQSRGER